MDRRIALGTMGGLLGGVALLKTVMGQDDHKHHEMMSGAGHCTKLCSECAIECGSCAAHCVASIHGNDLHQTTALLCLDCQTLCSTVAQILARSGPTSKAVCKLCAEVCLACAKACEKFQGDSHMAACAKKCRECAEACDAMSKA